MELISYSSGSGYLDIIWRDGDEASSRRVTKADAQRLLDRKDHAHLKATDWFVMPNHDGFKLVKKVERLSPNALLIKEIDFDSPTREVNFSEYEYSFDPEDESFKENGEVRDHNLQVRFYSAAANQEFDVKNISIRMVIRYFLSHEEEITEFLKANPIQPAPEPLPMMSASCESEGDDYHVCTYDSAHVGIARRKIGVWVANMIKEGKTGVIKFQMPDGPHEIIVK